MRANPAHLVAVLLLCSACADDGGGGGGGPAGVLTTGVYLVTASNETSDACNVGVSVDVNDTLNVTVNGDSISIGAGVSGDIDGNDIDAPDGSPNESTTTSGQDSCTAITSDDFTGTILGDDHFELEERYSVEVSGNWSQCPYTECVSRFTYRAQK